MGNIGYCTRGTRMLQIVKGSDLVSGVKQTAAYKVEDGFSCFSGEPLVATKKFEGASQDAMVWEKASNKSKTPVFFAFTDSDSFDVIAAGSLLGISTLDTFELQTPLFDETKTYTTGDPLTIAEADLYKNMKSGDVVCSSSVPTVDAANWKKLDKGVTVVTNAVADGDAIVGYVTEGVVTLKKNIAVDQGTKNDVYLDGYVREDVPAQVKIVGGPALYTEASGSKYVLQFATAWKPASK